MQTTLRIKGLELFAHHGLFAEERTLGQKFRIDVAARLADACSHGDDSLAHSVRYDALVASIAAVAGGEPFNTLEALAEAIGRRLFADYRRMEYVRVYVAKTNPPIAQTIASVGVEISLERATFAQQQEGSLARAS